MPPGVIEADPGETTREVKEGEAVPPEPGELLLMPDCALPPHAISNAETIKIKKQDTVLALFFTGYLPRFPLDFFWGGTCGFETILIGESQFAAGAGLTLVISEVTLGDFF